MNQTIKRFVKRIVLPPLAYTRSLLKGKRLPAEKFVLFFRPRSGSNLLRDLINCHPLIYCDEEIFRPGLVGKVQFPFLYIKGRAAPHLDQQVFGFKLNIHQIEMQQLAPEKFLAVLQQEGWKVVYIQRGNLLQQAVSFFVAQKRETWLDTSANALHGFKLTIDCQELLEKMARMENAVNREEQLLTNFPHLEIFYEQDLLSPEQHQATANRVFEFLGVAPAPVKANLVKTSAKMNPSEYIDNYQQMVAAVSQSKYASLLAQWGKAV